MLIRTLVMYVAVDEPGVRPRWGGSVAAPLFRRSMSRILSHLMAIAGHETMTTASQYNQKNPKDSNFSG